MMFIASWYKILNQFFLDTLKEVEIIGTDYKTSIIVPSLRKQGILLRVDLRPSFCCHFGGPL